jgi:hypothetical protein
MTSTSTQSSSSQSTTTMSSTLTTTMPSDNTTQTASPTADVSINVTLTFYSEIDVTNINMVVNNLQASEWAAFGLGKEKAMVNIKE